MSVTDGQHKVPIAIHRPAASLQPLAAKGQRSREARGRAPFSRRARGSPPHCPGPGAHRGFGGGLVGWEAARAQISFFSPLSLRSQSYKLIWSKKKKIIKKTYKITIEKVILLGEAPLRLREAFVLFLMQFPFRHTSTAFWPRV